MASQTQRALARRAIEAAELMDHCTKWLQKEATDQKVEWFSNATVMVGAQALGNMVYQMRGLSSCIREMEGHLTKETIRGRGHP
jgi:hypothetical protein